MHIIARPFFSSFLFFVLLHRLLDIFIGFGNMTIHISGNIQCLLITKKKIVKSIESVRRKKVYEKKKKKLLVIWIPAFVYINSSAIGHNITAKYLIYVYNKLSRNFYITTNKVVFFHLILLTFIFLLLLLFLFPFIHIACLFYHFLIHLHCGCGRRHTPKSLSPSITPPHRHPPLAYSPSTDNGRPVIFF